MFIWYKNPKQNLRFLEFLFFCFVRHGESTCKSGSLGEAPCRVPYKIFWTHFFYVAKKTLLSKGTLEICTRARPKTLPKKVPKNSFGGPSWAKNTETGPKNEKVCNLQKLILLGRVRIESGIMRGTLSGRRPRGNHGNVLWKKRVFFSKTCVFNLRRRGVPTLERPWGGRIGRASSTLCFFTKFLQKNTRPVARRDFRLATGNTLTWRILRD